jgi:dTDP-4-amino-4,6-dideoxygalactose transaminase
MRLMNADVSNFVRESGGERLALLGGTPVRARNWPKWPIPADGTSELLREVLGSGRWAISSPYLGTRSMGRRFAEAYAAQMGVRWCVPTSSGTASLTVALESLGVGPGDEVLVPGLTWVACASSVANINATPVLVDVDPETLCLSAEAVEAAITPRTAAIMAVHLYSAVADLDRLREIAARHGLALIEDCAQAHGAEWRGKRVGSIGRIGTFSMQHSKVLTSGEGGAVITSDLELFQRAQQLAADGRMYGHAEPPIGAMELLEVGTTQGSNWCLSEFHAAVLLAQLGELDCQNERRRKAAQFLDESLQSEGWTPQQTSPGTTARTYYQYAISFNPGDFPGIEAASLAKALTAEVGFNVSPTYVPLARNRLYMPHLRRRWHVNDGRVMALDTSRFELKNCERAHRSFLTFHHAALLAERADLEDIVEAFSKVRRLASQIL